MFLKERERLPVKDFMNTLTNVGSYGGAASIIAYALCKVAPHFFHYLENRDNRKCDIEVAKIKANGHKDEPPD
jgi:hypothetical protein